MPAQAGIHGEWGGRRTRMNLTTRFAFLALASALLLTAACERDSTPEESAALLELRAIFGTDLEHEDALRFESLSSELRAALAAQAEVVGQTSALDYLRAMPEDPPPALGRLVSPETMRLFQELDDARQRIVLLEGYTSGWERWLHDGPPSGDARFSLIGQMIVAAHVYLFPDDDKVPLPPYQDVLTSSEKAKLESMDPVLSSIFTRRWESKRVSPGLVERLKRELRRDLANAPTTMQGILDSGPLERRWGSLWEELPEALDFTRQYIAHRLITSGRLHPDDLYVLDRELTRLSDPKARETFVAGYKPGDRGEFPTPLACDWDASTGVWFGWAAPSAFRQMDPQDLVLAMPPLRDVLSGAALDKLESLEAELQREFGRFWYTSSGPAQAAACSALRTDHYLPRIPLTGLPEMSTLLTIQGLGLFEELPGYRQQDAIDLAVDFIVGGKVRIGGVYGQPRQEVDAYGLSPEEFLRALRTTAEIAVNVVANWDS